MKLCVRAKMGRFASIAPLTVGLPRLPFLTFSVGMDDYDVTKLPSEPLVIMCASTTGQGDAPDNMRAFWAFLLRKSLGADSLSDTTFAIFGLGDSGYAKYNAVAKRLEKRMEMLGHCFLPAPPGSKRLGPRNQPQVIS